MTLTDRLADRGIGEMEGGTYHFPSYTKGCWGQPGRKLCYLCKFRYLGALARIVRRTHSHGDD